MMTEHGFTREWSRREFSQASLTALLVGMTVWVGACGSDGGTSNSVSSPTPTGGSPAGASADKAGSVGTNHGHVATITSAQLQAGGAATLNIRGTSDHGHTIDLSAGEVAQIAAATRVTKNSSSDSGHSHSVTFN
jgi:hypothetical protein